MHRNAARYVVDDLIAEGSGQQKPLNNAHGNQHIPQYTNYLGPANAETTPHRTQAAAAVRKH